MRTCVGTWLSDMTSTCRNCVDLPDLVIEHVKHHDGAVTLAEERLADAR